MATQVGTSFLVQFLRTKYPCLDNENAFPTVFICTHRVVLASFVFLLSICLFSVLVRTAGCLSLSLSFVLAKALHVGFVFFSSLVIHITLLLSSCLSLLVEMTALVGASCQVRTRGIV